MPLKSASCFALENACDERETPDVFRCTSPLYERLPRLDVRLRALRSSDWRTVFVGC